MTTPAENTATVSARHREALVAVLNDVRPSPDWAWEILNAWDALLAQAEAGTVRSFSTTESGADYIQELQAARDAAVRERDQAREALRLIRDHRLDEELELAEATAKARRDMREIARAALTGEGTEEPEGKYGDWRDDPGNYGE